MGTTKYFVPDDDFYVKMRAAARNWKELGALLLLEHTGMHVSSLAFLTPDALRREGPRVLVYWTAPKPQRNVRSLRAPIPARDVDIVETWLRKWGGKRTERTWCRIVAEVGGRAGYQGVSPMTYRHQRIVLLMKRLNGDVRRVAALTGATFSTIEHHYAQAAPGLYEDEGLLEEGDAL